MNSARPIAWSAFLGGTAASVAANVTHAYLSTPGHAIGPQIAAAFWPLALLAAIEVITRVPWPRGFLWSLARYLGTGTVALGAATLSYRHMANLLAVWGEDPWNAHIGPLVVDGLMVVAGTALLAMSRGRTTSTEAATPGAAKQEVTTPEPTTATEPTLEPPAAPAPKPARVEVLPSAKGGGDAAKRQAAKDAWLHEHRTTGRDLNGTELGAMFEMSPAWGRARRAEARQSAPLALVP